MKVDSVQALMWLVQLDSISTSEGYSSREKFVDFGLTLHCDALKDKLAGLSSGSDGEPTEEQGDEV